jgi:ureidoglycolate hydrolase
VAPAPDRQSPDPRTYAFDYDHTAAFVVEPGQVAFIDKGVWHSLVPVGAACTFVNVTRKNASCKFFGDHWHLCGGLLGEPQLFPLLVEFNHF